LEEAGFPFSPEHEVQDLEHDPHLRHIGMFYETEHPKYGKIKGTAPARAGGWQP
jgi:crotonobetainyl-CoA:carnitine CoA-transferase CaiB-like acyl-CoA transferase